MSAIIIDSYVLILLIFNNFLVLLKQVLECKLPAVKPAFDTSELHRQKSSIWADRAQSTESEKILFSSDSDQKR